MNGLTDEVRDDPSRAELEQRANQLRNRFLRRLDTLDRRGHELVNAATELRAKTERAMPLALGVAGAVAVVGLAIYLGVSRRRRRPTPQVLIERLLREPRQESALGGAVKAAARALAVKALQTVAERAVERLTEASQEPLQLGARS